MISYVPAHVGVSVAALSILDPDTGLNVTPTNVTVVVVKASDGLALGASAPTWADYGSGQITIILDDPFALTPGVVYRWTATVTVGAFIQRTSGLFILGPNTFGGVVVADGGNTATTFKVTVRDGTGGVVDTADGWSGALLCLNRGAGASADVRRVTSYNAATDFVTLTEALPSAPATGDKFNLIVV